MMVSSVSSQLTNDPSDIERVFTFADTSTLRRMIRHAIKVIEGVLVVDDPIYFMALSDQVHFFGAYASIMLIRLIETARNTKPDLSITDELVVKALNLVSTLSVKFQLLGDGENDLATKYANCITETRLSCNLV